MSMGSVPRALRAGSPAINVIIIHSKYFLASDWVKPQA